MTAEAVVAVANFLLALTLDVVVIWFLVATIREDW